jgi:dihydroorotate dehydrogenase
MVDLRSDFLGIKSPNPFWLASAPPTDRKTNVERAFRAGAASSGRRSAKPGRRSSMFRARAMAPCTARTGA